MGRRFVVITGPTASGKTRVSVKVATALGSCVISADSMQIYKGMNIGTAKVTPEEKQGVPHYMIDIITPDQSYSVAEYQKTVFELIERENSKEHIPIIAGGTGLYIHSLVYDIDFTNTPGNDTFRQKYLQLADDKSIKHLYNELRQKDPAYASIIEPGDLRRIVRRLEIIENGGAGEYDFRRMNTRDDMLIIGIDLPRETLYSRINARVDGMLANGLVEEARRIYNQYGMVNALKAIGYKELIAHFEGSMSLEEAAEVIKRNTRRYAKRQMTWFRRDERIKWVDFDASLCIEDTINDIIMIIKEKGF